MARGGRPWRRLVAYVVRRDGGICHLCGRPGADSADHLIPVAEGGTDDPSNLRAVHHNAGPRCNRVRGTLPVDAVRPWLEADGRDWTW